MKVIRSNDFVEWDVIPTGTPSATDPQFGRVTGTDSVYYWSGVAWVLLPSISTPGIDDVLGVGQSFTSPEFINTDGYGLDIRNGSNRFALLNGGNDWAFGDLDNSNDGAKLKYDNNIPGLYYDNSAHTVLFGINTSSPSVALDVVGDCHISGTVLNLPNLPIYADEAAAIIGGIATGDVYRTVTGELRIKL